MSPQARGLRPDGGQRKFGVADVVAGVSVALILIPQSLAYAVIAGVPPRYGMYSAALPPIAAAPFASSPYLQTGPVAMTALLTFGALSAVAEPFTTEWIELAALLALAVGVVRLAFGLFRLGFVAYFMSQPVVQGFTIGAAILIIASQIPAALGSMAPEGGLLERAAWALVHPGSWDWATIAYAAATLVTVEVGRRLGPRFPGVLVAVVAAILTSLAFGFDGATVGDVPSEFIPFTLDLPYAQDILANGRRRRSIPLAAKLTERHSGHLDVNVDSIHERSADTRQVALDLQRAALALLASVSVVAARAWIHGRDQHELRRKTHCCVGPRNRHPPVLQRLP